MTGKTKKILSFILAFCIIFSCMIPAFATGVTYKATYTKRAPKRMYAETLQDANELIANKALNGKTIEELYKTGASMAIIVTEAKTQAFYTKAERTIFSKLSTYMRAEKVTEVTPEVLAGYFAKYPVVIKDAEDFTLKVNHFVDAIVTDNLATTITTVLLYGAILTPEIGEKGAVEYYANIDNMCKALGIKQDKAFTDILLDQSKNKTKDMAAYLKNVINAVLPEVTNNVLGFAKNLADDKNNALFYGSLTDFLTRLNFMIKKLAPMIGSIAPGVDLSGVVDPVSQASDFVNALPTTMKGNDRMFDYQECVAYLVNEVLGDEIMKKLPADVQKFIPKDAKLIRFKRDNWNKLCLLRLDDFNMANIKYAGDEVDVLNVLYHYLYKNMNRTSNKLLLYPAFKLIPVVAPEAPKDIISYANYMLTHREDNSAYKFYKGLHIATEHKLIFLCDAAAGEFFYEVGERITIEAPEAPEGKMFDRWEVVTGNVKLDNPNAPHTSFIMPEHDVEIVPVYKDIEYTAVIGNTVRTFVMGDVVSLNAEDWTVVDGDVELVNGMNNEVLFVMPSEDVEVADAKSADVPETDVPETEAPETEAPETEAPKAEAPKAEASKDEAPETQTKAPNAQEQKAENKDELKVPNTGSALAVFPAMAAAAFAGLAFATAKHKKEED